MVAEIIAFLAAVGRCPCGARCEAWICDDCAFASHHYAARFNDDQRSSTATALGRASERRQARATAHEIMLDLVSIPDPHVRPVGNAYCSTSAAASGDQEEGAGYPRAVRLMQIGLRAATIGAKYVLEDRAGRGDPKSPSISRRQRGFRQADDHPWRQAFHRRNKTQSAVSSSASSSAHDRASACASAGASTSASTASPAATASESSCLDKTATETGWDAF